MAAYKFIIEGRSGFEPVLLELPTDVTAWREATTLCGELVKDELEPSTGFRLLVLDGNGVQLFQISIAAT
ncbi:hypothetical protein QA640_09015 [Bradyrhizobium sp. CB82]|uniref:DUF6894 family protein n=1 Tax=Bradyrhizobium sp. CB82 TaxID=3039159 RepID=UPI0024B0F48B|nr:hypothetical protein [Bradyrhizobium sp. CB82]WFU42583.1 hypothetical protein QA640_09015 [Bradyrhizobium sp. CB82]